MFDITSYIIGLTAGEGQGVASVIIDSDAVYTDDGEGNITVTNSEQNGQG